MSRIKEQYRDQVDQDYIEQAEQRQQEKDDFLYQTEVLDKSIIDDKQVGQLPLFTRMVIAEHRFKLMVLDYKPIEK